MSLSKNDKKMVVNMYRAIVGMMLATASKNADMLRKAAQMEAEVDSHLDIWKNDDFSGVEVTTNGPEIVICERADSCSMKFECGGATPHDRRSCDPCPKGDGIKCVPVIICREA